MDGIALALMCLVPIGIFVAAHGMNQVLDDLYSIINNKHEGDSWYIGLDWNYLSNYTPRIDYYQLHRFRFSPLSKKKIFQPQVNQYSRIDHMLNTLSIDERAYLERKLGAGDLVLSDDGELITLEEYRQRKVDEGE